MFISVKHQRQQQEVEFWFPAIGAYQLLQAKETVYHTDDLSSWTLCYVVSFTFRACKNWFVWTQVLSYMSGSREITSTVIFVFQSSRLMTVYGQTNSFLNIWNVFFNIFSVFFLIEVLHNVHFVYYEKKCFYQKKIRLQKYIIC